MKPAMRYPKSLILTIALILGAFIASLEATPWQKQDFEVDDFAEETSNNNNNNYNHPNVVEHQRLDSNIEDATIEIAPNDLVTAAGHHHHHHHYVHGKLDMGAHTGKKGAFGWHSKHPVGGKGRR